MITLIVGPEGSGKNEQLKILTGRYAPNEVEFYSYITCTVQVPAEAKLIVIDQIPSEETLFEVIHRKLVEGRSYILISSAIDEDRAFALSDWLAMKDNIGVGIIACPVIRKVKDE